MSDHEPVIGSLCSGYGGLDLGVQAVLGGRVAWHVEYDKDPSAILRHHWPHVPNHGDVKTTDWANVEPIDVLTAGYPCQPFSHAGKRKGSDDPRHLWPDVARAIGVLRPRLVVLENVRGHVSLGLADVLGDLSGLGYDATWGVVRAADAGAPHGRARIFITATDAQRADGWAATRDGGATRELVASARRIEGATAPGGDWSAAADAADVRRDRSRGTRRGRTGSPNNHLAAPDASSERHGRGQDGGGLGRLDDPDAGTPRERERTRGITVDRGAAAAADAEHDGPPAAPLRRSTRPGDGEGRLLEPQGPPADSWGPYSAAVRRWERVIGRPAPDPTEPGRNGPRLAPAFVEWLMGLDAGHVTDVPDLSRNAQLKALGNGVVPQQAALALRILLPILTGP